MTDRIKGLTIVLEDNIRDDDCDRITDAIGMVKGVVSVIRHVEDDEHYMAKQQVKREIGGKIMELVRNL